MKQYPVSEEFFSIQGEGVHSGRGAYFVRLYGCNVKCPWCDTKYAWLGEPPFVKTADQISESAKRANAPIAVITGGEPCIHYLSPLAAALKREKICVHLETSGTLRICEEEVEFDWVAVSPKLFARPLEESIARADEIKLIVSNISEMSEYEKILNKISKKCVVWLHPEWSRSGDKNLLEDICKYVMRSGSPFRAGWQMHKNYFVK